MADQPTKAELFPEDSSKDSPDTQSPANPNAKNETMETIQVGPDDTLTSIAFQRQMSLEMLKRINKIGDSIYPGQTLKVYKKKPMNAPPAPSPKKETTPPSTERVEISDAGAIFTNAAKTYQNMQKTQEELKKPSRDKVSHKGSLVQVQPNLEEEKAKSVQKDSVDIVLDNLRKSNTFKCDASYMTIMGEVKGSFIVSPYFLIFDPELSAENKHLIPSASAMSRFQCFIDTGDITECCLIILPSPDAVEEESPEFYDDYYLQLMLSSVEGNLYQFILLQTHISPNSPKKEPINPPSEPNSKKEAIGTVHFKLGFKQMDKVPNQLRKRIALIVTEKLNTYCSTNKGRKHNFSSTYIPFYDRNIAHPLPSDQTGTGTTTKYVDRALKLKDKSEILTEEMLEQLGAKISPLLRMRPWEIVFRINTDGVSLRTFFKNVERYNPTILVIQDHNKCVFGAFVSEQWKPSGRFYGTGEAFLFTFKNKGKMEAYRWTGTNEQIMFSDFERVAVGGGKCFGLAVEDNFLQGRTGKCETFDNELLTETEEFQISNFEVIGLEYL